MAEAEQALDLEGKIDALYQLPLGEFIGRRDALVVSLRSGDKDAAKRVKSMAKPSVTAWAVNQVYWNTRVAYDDLLEAGENLRAAQQQGDADDLRAAMRARRDALDALIAKAEAILAASGHAASPASLRRISQSFEALATYGENPPEPGAGRLSRDLGPPGLDILTALAAVPTPFRPPKRTAVTPTSEEAEAARCARAELTEAEAAAEVLRLQTRRAAAAREQAEARAEIARVKVDEAERRVEELRLRATKAADLADEARTLAGTVEREQGVATERLAQARARLEDIES